MRMGAEVPMDVQVSVMTESLINNKVKNEYTPSPSQIDSNSDDPVVYGQLIVLGYVFSSDNSVRLVFILKMAKITSS